MKEKTFYEIIHNSNKEELTNIILKMDSCPWCIFRNTNCGGRKCKEGVFKKLESRVF